MRKVTVASVIWSLGILRFIIISGEGRAQQGEEGFAEIARETNIHAADSIDVVVDGSYTYDTDDSLYTYTYRVVSQYSSQQRVSAIGLALTGTVVQTTGPVGWTFGQFQQRPLVHWYASILSPGEQYYLAPLQEAVFTVTSRDPPGDAWIYVQGHVPLPELTRATAELPELYPALFDITLNSVRLKTIAPQRTKEVALEVSERVIAIDKWRDSVTVRVLGNREFDPGAVPWRDWSFGPGAGREMHETAHVNDVDGDGLLEAELHFRVGSIGVRPEDTNVCLSAHYREGWVRGCASVVVTLE